MITKRLASVAAVLALLALGAPARADQKPAGLKGDLIGSLDDAGKKLVSLAEATPADKFGWRPAADVRSMAEVFMHVATANYTIPSFIGVKAPEGTGFEMEKQITEKAKVVDFLKGSIAHLKKAIAEAPDADMDKMVKIFGMDMSHRGVLLLLVAHDHEHLGQAIAYARSNGIVPPWSKPEPKVEKPSEKK